MKQSDLFGLLEISDVHDIPKAINEKLFSDTQNKNEFFDSLIKLNNYDMSFDWFQGIFESEMAQRNQNKQDFTPNQVGVLLGKITSQSKGKIYEPTAGNGSLLIAKWWETCKDAKSPFIHRPSENVFECWELSNRCVPILLLNLSIRGMMGVVYHGDVLEQRIINKYILLNRNDFTLGFSEIIHDVELNLKIVENEI